MEEEEARQEPAEQIGIVLIDGVAAGEIDEDDMPLIEHRAEIDRCLRLSDDGADRGAAGELRYPIQRPYRLHVEVTRRAAEPAEACEERLRRAIRHLRAHQGADAVRVFRIVEQLGFREREPELGERDERRFEHALHRRLLVDVLIVPHPRERFERRGGDHRERDAFRPRERIEADRMRQRIGIDDVDGAVDPPLGEPGQDRSIQTLRMIAVRIDDAHSPAREHILPDAVFEKLALPAARAADDMGVLEARPQRQEEGLGGRVAAEDERRRIDRHRHRPRLGGRHSHYAGFQSLPFVKRPTHRVTSWTRESCYGPIA